MKFASLILLALLSNNFSSNKWLGHKPITISESGRHPEVAVRNKKVAISFADKNKILCSISTDGGLNFSTPHEVGSLSALALGMGAGPKAAISESFVTIVAIDREDNHLYCWMSDGSPTWKGPFKITSGIGRASEGLCAIAALSRDELCVIWIEMEMKKKICISKLSGSVSADGGATWSGPFTVYESPEKKICACCKPNLVFDGKLVHAMWRNNIHGARDMYIATSADGGRTFGKAKKIGSETWRIDSCPTDGGGIAVNEKGEIMTVWRRKDNIYLAGDNGSEKELSKGHQPDITYGPEGAYKIWEEDKYIFLLPPNENKPVKVHSGAYPSIASTSGDHAATIASWERVDHGGGIMAMRIDKKRE